MKKSVLSLFFILIVFCASLFLFGCQNQKIEFNRESAVTSLIKKTNNPKTQVKSSSGIIILRDEEQTPSININFGPRDINFDMPARFK